jgi:hypothetical protein
MKFAKYSFLVAGIYGLLVLVPQYFLEEKNSLDFPPAITHPEYYYGFLGVAVAWQVAFLVIAQNPVRYRLMMIPAIIEKFSFAIAVYTLFALGRVAPLLTALGTVDLIFGLLFITAFLKTRNE